MTTQFGRRASLVISEGERGLDLSEFRFTFQTVQQDVESPANATIRVYNLSDETSAKVRGEYSTVTLQAGYDGGFGLIFSGTIKQFRIGRENATTKYLDILAADGDVAYNWSTVNKTLSAGSKPEDRIRAAVEAMGAKGGVTPGYLMPFSGGILPRGKVLFGMARSMVRSEAENQGATWNISNGQLNVIPRDGFLPGEALKLNALTGMIGLPEQTDQGLRVRTLLNPNIVIGKLIQIDNKSINQTLNRNPNAPPGPAFDRYVGVQLLATTTNDGIYRVYVAEHRGDTRGQDWYTDIIALAVDTDSKKVRAQ